GVDVGHDDVGPLLHEVTHQVGADLADAGDRDAPAFERALAPQMAGHRLHPVQDPVGGRRGRVTGTSEGPAHAGDVARLATEEVHVGLGGADVLRGDVAPAE